MRGADGWTQGMGQKRVWRCDEQGRRSRAGERARRAVTQSEETANGMGRSSGIGQLNLALDQIRYQIGRACNLVTRLTRPSWTHSRPRCTPSHRSKHHSRPQCRCRCSISPTRSRTARSNRSASAPSMTSARSGTPRASRASSSRLRRAQL